MGQPPLNTACTIYDADPYNGDVRLQLWITSGPSYGMRLSYERTVVAPTGGCMVLKPGTTVKHVKYVCSCGFHGIRYVYPKYVSFKNIQTREGECNGIGSGYCAADNGLYHDPSGWAYCEGGNSTTGCPDGFDDDWIEYHSPHTPYSDGDFLWPIPIQYMASDGQAQILTSSQDHHVVIDATGKCTISKYGAGPYSRDVLDDMTSWP
jgi:hypothetical protein